MAEQHWTEAIVPGETAEETHLRLNTWNSVNRPIKTEKWLGEDGSGYETEYGFEDEELRKRTRYSTGWFMVRAQRVNEGTPNSSTPLQSVQQDEGELDYPMLSEDEARLKKANRIRCTNERSVISIA